MRSWRKLMGPRAGTRPDSLLPRKRGVPNPAGTPHLCVRAHNPNGVATSSLLCLTQRAQRPQRKGGIEKNESRVLVHFMGNNDSSPRFLFPLRPLRATFSCSTALLRLQAVGHGIAQHARKILTRNGIQTTYRLKPGLHTGVAVTLLLLTLNLSAAGKKPGKMASAKVPPGSPEIFQLEPRGIQRGVSSKIKLIGTNLVWLT